MSLAPDPTPRTPPPFRRPPRPRTLVRPGEGSTTGVAIEAKVGSTVQVNVNGTLRVVQVSRDLSVAIGDVLLLHRSGGNWYASVKLYSAATSGEPPMQLPDMDPNVSPPQGSLTVLPVYASTYQTALAAWRADEQIIVQGIGTAAYGNQEGAAFYGDKPRSLAGATVTAARLETIFRTNGPSGSTGCTLWLVTESTRPAGAPTRTLSTAGPNTDLFEGPVSFTIPTAWAQSIVDGTAGGIGVADADGSPYCVFSGRGARSTAFSLVIDWRR